MIHPLDVSVVLLSYARPWNMPIIVQSLLDYGFDDIHIVDNWVEDDLLHAAFTRELKGKVKLVKAGMNCRTAGRTLPLDDFENDVIATVDDDYLVTERGWDNLLGGWEGDKIVAQVPNWNRQFDQAYKVPFLNIGYGSLYRKEWPAQIYTMLHRQEEITQEDWLRFADRTFTTFFGRWDVFEATDDTLVKLKNPNGTSSETDKSSIHLKEDYWRDQWALVTRIIIAREKFRDMTLRGDPILSEYEGQMEYLYHAAYSGSPAGNG